MTQDLPTVTRLGILEAEAGNRTQSEGSCMPRTGVIRSPYGETEPRKVPNFQAGIHLENPDLIRAKKTR